MVRQIFPFTDTPSLEPGLFFKNYARILAEFLMNADPPNLTIGIFGGYGAGKTTLMNAIKSDLPSEDEGYFKVSFNAWRYDHEEHLFLPFLAAINAQISVNDSSITEKITAAARGFLRGFSLKVNTGFFEAKINSKDALEFESKLLESRAESLLKEYVDSHDILRGITINNDSSRKIVIFIDDLDRCVPQKAFALIESLKSYMDIDGFLFVLGLDPRVIQKYIYRKYGSKFIDPNEYLEKIVQVPFYLPKPMPDHIFSELNIFFSKINEEERKMFEDSFSVLKDYFPYNLRKIKRIFNAFQIIRSLDKSLDSNTILALLVVQVRWPSIFWALFKFNLEFDKVWLDCKKKFKDTDYELKYKLSHSLYISLVDNDFSSFYQKFIYKNVPPDSIYKCLNFIGLPIDIEEKQKVEVIR